MQAKEVARIRGELAAARGELQKWEGQLTQPGSKFYTKVMERYNASQRGTASEKRERARQWATKRRSRIKLEADRLENQLKKARRGSG